MLNSPSWLHAVRVEFSEFLSLIVPARHEQAVLGGTLERLASSRHPAFEVLSVVGDDDPETRQVAEATAARHPDRVRVLVDASQPKNKPKALNTALPECRGTVTAVFDAEDEVHPELLAHVNPGTLRELLKQRTRWNQGFLQVLRKGEWRRLPTRRQRLLARYALAMPFLQAFTGVLIPVARYPRGWRDFDDLVSAATLRAFPDRLPQAAEAVRNSRPVASFGHGTERVEIGKLQGSPL